MNGTLNIHGVTSIAVKDGSGDQFTWTDIVLRAYDGSTFEIRLFPEEAGGRLRVEQPEPQEAEA